MKNEKKSRSSAKILAFIALIALVSCAALEAQTLGDVNSSGSIDIVDALLVAQYYVGLAPSNFNTAYADADCSGAINIVDALRIAQLYVGIISQLPCTLTPTPAPTAAGGNITVWMAGDSTMAKGGSTCPVGWGEQFRLLFDTRVTLNNNAVAGRGINQWMYNVLSTANAAGDCDMTLDSNGKPTTTTQWQAMLDGMKAGDYLFVSFGINDGTTACPRHASQTTFIADLGVMAQAAKARGAIPVFLTPTSSISCSGSTAVGTRGAYVDYTISAGSQFGATVIKLHQLSVNLYNASGFCPLPGGATDITATTGGAVGAFFCDDHTHFDTTGAAAIAGIVATALRNQNIGLAAYLK
jgi:lysophospholipase L1-like esterase